MRCPFCKENNDKVIDSRSNHQGALIRRRRLCLACKRRFTTYERVEVTLPMVVKKDNSRESFDRDKILSGVKKACDKRNLTAQTLEELVDRVEATIYESYEREVPARDIGERVTQELKALDPVAYVRFASVYRRFEDVSAFQNVLENLMKQKTGDGTHK